MAEESEAARTRKEEAEAARDLAEFAEAARTRLLRQPFEILGGQAL